MFDLSGRLTKLDALDVDAVVLVPGANLRYFTGLVFIPTERPIIALYRPGAHELAIVLPDFEVPRLYQETELTWQVFPWTDREGFGAALSRALNELDLKSSTLGVDDLNMRLFEWLALSKAEPGLSLAPLGQDLLETRVVKSKREIDCIRMAVRSTESALGNMLSWIEPGMTERTIAAHLAEEIIAEGCEGLSFPPLVLSGRRTLLPHGLPSDRKVAEGDLLLIDCGGMVEGYRADIARTYCMGKPSDEVQHIYQVVSDANRAARSAAAPGVPCGEVDHAARQVIEEAGFGDSFFHRTGHAIGLDIHEPPQIAQGETRRLEPGMVFTVEPGIYLPKIGAIRLEDDVVVTPQGAESLSLLPHDLVLELD